MNTHVWIFTWVEYDHYCENSFVTDAKKHASACEMDCRSLKIKYSWIDIDYLFIIYIIIGNSFSYHCYIVGWSDLDLYCCYHFFQNPIVKIQFAKNKRQKKKKIPKIRMNLVIIVCSCSNYRISIHWHSAHALMSCTFVPIMSPIGMAWSSSESQFNGFSIQLIQNWQIIQLNLTYHSFDNTKVWNAKKRKNDILINYTNKYKDK